MLKLDFINVGDGDAILVRAARPGREDYVILVDCGRPHVEFTKGSKRRHAINYLMKERIDHIDLMVISHLHFDHVGGALTILHHIPVRRLMALHLPPENAQWICAPECDEKTVIGLCDALNLFRDVIDFAHEKGCVCVEAINEDALNLFRDVIDFAHEKGCVCVEAINEKEVQCDALDLTVFLPDESLIERQRQVFNALYLGKMPLYDDLYVVSKERNCSSLIVRLDYAGRSILLTGDSYASYWEESGQQRCDILKLPHHGDEKSMTETLIRRLAPDYAVVSCQNDTSSKKERPAAFVIDMVQKYVPKVLCTENRELPSLPASAHEAVRFIIDTDGSISCLDRQ